MSFLLDLRHRRLIAVSFLLLFASGCDELTLTSEYMPPNAGGSPPKGSVYYLPHGMIPLSIKPVASGGMQIAQSAVQMTPDRKARFLAVWHESSLSLDKFSLSVDQNGLLQSINSDVTDQTPQIVQKIVDIATQAALAAASQAPGGGSPSEPASCQGDLLIDPFRGSSIRQANALLSKCKLHLSVSYPTGEQFPTRWTSKQYSELEASVVDKAIQCGGSLCFRPVTPVLLKIRGKIGQANVDSSFLVAVPNLDEIVSYDLKRGPCIQRVGTLTFSSGLLQKADLTKPSEILGCLDIPLSVAKAFAQIPSQVLTLQVNNATSQASLLAQQNQILLNQQALLQTKLTQSSQ